MKRLICMVIGFFLCATSALADGDKEKMGKWAGVSRIDSFFGAKAVFNPNETKTSYHGNVIFYPLAWTNENGANLLGFGYKGNYSNSFDGNSQRHLGQADLRGYREWGNFRFAILGGIQEEKYGKSEYRYNLYGVGGYLSLHHVDSDGKKYFPKTEFWGQILKADGRNSKSTTEGIVDVGGRQYFHEGFAKPFVEANLSLGTPDRYASLGIGFGLTDEKEIFYLSVGPQFDLRHGGVPMFVNMGLDPNNLFLAIMKHDARDRVQKAP